MKTAFGLIDAQRGFMPSSETTDYNLPGFGELGVERGEEIIVPVNRLLAYYATKQYDLFTTQDWHPETTAHFSDQPNFVTTWPRHCVGETPGAELHPAITLPPATTRFIKGTEPLLRGEDDTSYSGYYSHNAETDESLSDWLEKRGVTHVALGGLALDYCVGKTALGLKNQLSLDVTVVLDASRAIAPDSERAMLDAFNKAGVKTVATADDHITNLQGT